METETITMLPCYLIRYDILSFSDRYFHVYFRFLCRLVFNQQIHLLLMSRIIIIRIKKFSLDLLHILSHCLERTSKHVQLNIFGTVSFFFLSIVHQHGIISLSISLTFIVYSKSIRYLHGQWNNDHVITKAKEI